MTELPDRFETVDDTYEDEQYGELTGAVRRTWLRNGVVHRDDDLPAVIVFDPDDPTIPAKQEWWQNGYRHRDRDKPAIVREYRDNADYHWFQKNRAHRVGKPAELEYVKGRLWKELWATDGKIHRDEAEGPAITYFDVDSGFLSLESWYKNNALHRRNGPAKTWYFDDTGSVESVEWFYEGESHREDGPDFVLYNKDGSVNKATYSNHDTTISVVVGPTLDLAMPG